MRPRREKIAHCKRPARLQGGFTLIELVIAIGILGIIMGIAYASLSQIIRSKTALDDERDLSMVANAVINRLSRELQLVYYGDGRENLLPPRNNLKGPSPSSTTLLGEQRSLSNGEAGDSITFLASEAGQYLPDGGTHTGIVQITYRAEPNPEQSSDTDSVFFLIRDETPKTRPYDQAYKRTMTFPVTSRLVGLEFKYFNGDKEEWASSWGQNGESKLPLIIQFSFSLRSPAGKIRTYASAVPVEASR